MNAARIDRRRGFAWGWVTPHGQRFYGIDFGRFAVGLLIDAPLCVEVSPEGERCKYLLGHDSTGQPHSWTRYGIGGF